LIIPNTYGVPVAFLGVPNTALLAAADVPPDEGGLELLELQPAAASPMTASAAAQSHL
jgi:hypothetical protein